MENYWENLRKNANCFRNYLIFGRDYGSNILRYVIMGEGIKIFKKFIEIGHVKLKI